MNFFQRIKKQPNFPENLPNLDILIKLTIRKTKVVFTFLLIHYCTAGMSNSSLRSLLKNFLITVDAQDEIEN